MAYEYTGTVKVIGEVQTFPSGFSKREIVVTSEDERYPQDVVFEFIKERAELLNSINEADRVKITFDIGGREYNGRYFNNLKGWRVEKLDEEGGAFDPTADAAGTPDTDITIDLDEDDLAEDNDDLPF
ncbi:MAG: DUF3127 domain-containing protein [Lentisphaerae bacterium]|jgi:single-strand DNA-binding protein|nr:DUF3127 domain-containing protein [Lentisphaerota bacterium]